MRDWIALQGKDGFANRPVRIYPGSNLMGHAAAIGIAAGIIMAQDNIVQPYVSVI